MRHGNDGENMRVIRKIISWTILALCIVLFAGSIGLSIRSYKLSDNCIYVSKTPQVQQMLGVASASGTLIICQSRYTGNMLGELSMEPGLKFGFSNPTVPRLDITNAGTSSNGILWQKGGFVVICGSSDVPAQGNLPLGLKITERIISVPFWFITLLSGLWLIRVFLKWRSRFPKGHCQKCGYDLRATPERCPECGTETAAKICA